MTEIFPSNVFRKGLEGGLFALCTRKRSHLTFTSPAQPASCQTYCRDSLLLGFCEKNDIWPGWFRYVLVAPQENHSVIFLNEFNVILKVSYRYENKQGWLIASSETKGSYNLVARAGVRETGLLANGIMCDPGQVTWLCSWVFSPFHSDCKMLLERTVSYYESIQHLTQWGSWKGSLEVVLTQIIK